MTIPKPILDSIKRVTPLSQSALKLLELAGKPQYRLADIVAVVQNDAVLTGNILRIVNSAAYARRIPIDTITRAVPLVGEKVMVGIALGLCTAHVLNQPLDGYEGERGTLWRHSLRAAIASRELAPYAAGVHPEVAYTAAILHDAGKAVISVYLEGRTREALHKAESFNVGDYVAAERELLGTDHCEVGAALAEHWRLPAVPTEVIRHHHRPQGAAAEYRALAYAVHLGDFAAMMAGTGTGADTLLYRLDPEYRQFVKISLKELDQVMLKTEAEFGRAVAATFGEEGKAG